MKEFFGFGGYQRPAEGYLSWQHLTFVTSLMVIMVICAAVLGLRNKHKDEKSKNKVLVVTAIVINAIEIFKIVMMCIRAKNPMGWVYNLPLFLCSIQLIAIPLAAATKGRVKEAALDFVTVFGLLGAVIGTYCAGQNYGCYPVLSLDNVASGLTHSISGFASLYILIVGMASMKKKNILITFGILGAFCLAAFVANIFTDSNYMFLLRGDGTPYDILYGWVDGNKVLYPIGVILLFLMYISAYYLAYYFVAHSIEKHKAMKDKTVTA